ncbi:MAG TPA: hypothetical protein VF807_04250 [Ktedonobacterales bacterium]
MSQRLPIASVFSMDTGGCGACQQSIAALSAVRHLKALSASGLSFTETPRSANIVLLTGALSVATESDVRQILGGIPEPKVLVAVGDCANGGCVFSGSPLLAANAADALDVHVEVGGCPASPTEILAAIQRAQQMLATSETHDTAAAEPVSATQGENA